MCMQSKFVSLVSIGALFGALGMVSQSAAAAVGVSPVFGACPAQTGFLAGRTSAVLSHVQQPVTDFIYNFKVCNTSAPGNDDGQAIFLLRDWELPYDPAGGIANFTTPSGWGAAIETIGTPNDQTGWDGENPTWFNPTDPFYDPRYLGLTQVIHFYTCGFGSCYGSDANVFGDPLFPGQELAGFGFTSPFGETNAPYQASWIDLRPRSGDPAFPNPGGPNTPGLLNNVPEPGGFALFAVALGAMMAARGRRRETTGE